MHHLANDCGKVFSHVSNTHNRKSVSHQCCSMDCRSVTVSAFVQRTVADTAWLTVIHATANVHYHSKQVVD